MAAVWSCTALLTYAFGYLYVWQYLSEFGVSPEEVGISQVKLLTRAGIAGLFWGPTIMFLVAPVLYFLYGLLWKSGLLEDIGEIRATYQSASPRVKELAVGLAFVFCIIVLVILPKIPGIIIAGLIAFLAVVVMIPRPKKSALVAGGTAIVLFAIVSLAFFVLDRATAAASRTVRTGARDGVLLFLGEDLVQVQPTWLDKASMPDSYAGGGSPRAWVRQFKRIPLRLPRQRDRSCPT